MAGHSKWANIKHRKAAVDARRGKAFTKASKEIIVAARLGGGDPESNSRLRMAIQNARALSVPNDNIKRAIQRGTGEIEGVTYEEITYEGYGPGGVAVIVECTTENRNRTVAELRATFSKCDGNLGESNSVAWNFTHKGELRVETSQTEEALFDIALEAGADDVEMIDDGALIHCSTDMLGACNNALMSRNLTVAEARFTYEPNMTVEVTNPAIVKNLIKLLDMLEDNDDVQNVYNNADIPDHLL
ncbi:MAG: YebC/PmpR family DNA-binding transcriptional regulator ['Candidatus Kapabacteria' thiocyanatum]|uniref:Probable transcriptional regulatory protein BGO89_01165 n=1 Tax=Candidatus Kapaibacterium thiocyanatum TaxID=1895771 RepID=A0A1M3L6N0_9BACT|nr:YebC/PmpR family DNA-binding transcriptional regulator ['Candidatus Kapabacteria' thiocyanatum]OJX61226.1 MAG: transcriptional regulator ['Candidatus Kapabacteria' thiocyanatum]